MSYSWFKTKEKNHISRYIHLRLIYFLILQVIFNVSFISALLNPVMIVNIVKLVESVKEMFRKTIDRFVIKNNDEFIKHIEALKNL